MACEDVDFGFLRAVLPAVSVFLSARIEAVAAASGLLFVPTTSAATSSLRYWGCAGRFLCCENDFSIDVMISMWSESESGSSHGWCCSICFTIPGVAKVGPSVFMLLADLRVTVPCDKVGYRLLCAVVSTKSSEQSHWPRSS
jgi:hypothetical protein